jgi:Na+/melibiose symporter-like transporter
MLEIFYKTFLETTDPNTEYYELASFHVVYSIIVNVILYTIAYGLLVHLFNLPKKYKVFVGVVICVMVLGYIGRLARVKSIYNVLLEQTDIHHAREKAMKTIRQSYFTWYFLS